MKKVLLISYYYPPMPEVGGLRCDGFNRYLASFGWKPYVLTVKNPDRFYCSTIKNYDDQSNVFRAKSLFSLSLIAGKANGLLTKIFKLFNYNFDKAFFPNLLLVPDFAMGWILPAVYRGIKIVKKLDVDVVFATSKPNSCSLIGALISRYTNVPLILDFRDPWRKIIFQMSGYNATQLDKTLPDWRDKIDKRIEKFALKQSDYVTFTTEITCGNYKKLYPFLLNKCDVIYNGFKSFESSNQSQFKKFTIVYAGNYYFELDYSENFFEALSYIKKNKDLSQDLEFLYIGSNPTVKALVEKYSLQKITRFAGYLSQYETITYMSRSSILLLRNIPPCLSTKIFEGLSLGIPILALLNDEDEAKDIISKNSKEYFIVNPTDTEKIIESIYNFYDRWKKGILKHQINYEFIENFSKKAATKKLISILNQITN